MAEVEVMSVPTSAGQVACLILYIVFLALWGYAELLAMSKRAKSPHLHMHMHMDEEAALLVAKEGEKDAKIDKESPPVVPSSPRLAAMSPTNGSSSIAGSGAVRCMLLDQRALLEAIPTLRAGVEFGTILLWYYLADRTTVFPRMAKHYSRDVLSFIFLGLTIVAAWTSLKRSKSVVVLNRNQTDEWKGWMQVLFLLYHYFEAREIYNAIRVFIAGYVWMTGFGNFSYYYKTNDFGFGRFCNMMWRLNFLVMFACLVLNNSYMLYYICPMHTLFTIFVYASLGIASKYNATHTGILLKLAATTAFVFVFWDIKAVFYTVWAPFDWLMGYTDPRKPGSDRLYEWYFRSSLDRYVWIHGMLCAYLHPHVEAFFVKIDGLTRGPRYAARAAVLGVCGVIGALWYSHVYCLPKLEYNAVHPYTSWIPISLWVVLRNLTPPLRSWALGLYGWLGAITLETYISQFHVWLSTGIPDGQPKMLLQFFPAEYPLLNFAATSAVYVFTSYRLFQLTGTLKSAAIPAKAGPLMLRNFSMMAAMGGALYVAGLLLLNAGLFATTATS